MDLDEGNDAQQEARGPGSFEVAPDLRHNSNSNNFEPKIHVQNLNGMPHTHSISAEKSVPVSERFLNSPGT